MKIFKILMFMCLIIFLTGCQLKKTDRASEDYRYGTQGLVLNFLQNFPPSRLYDDEPFDVTLETANTGAYDAGGVNDKVYLSGFDPSIITSISINGEKLPALEGKNAFNPQGTFDYVSFKGILRNLRSRNIDKYPFRLFATACYNYKTFSSSNICIDPDPYSPTTKEKVCIPQSISLGNQGAPIAISSVDVEASPGRTRFKIHINNAGGGEVFKGGANYLSKCSPYNPSGLEFNDMDYIKLNKVEVSGVSILSSCKPLNNGYLKLTNNYGFVICEIGSPKGSSAYVTPLVIELDYGYRSSVSKNVEILSSN